MKTKLLLRIACGLIVIHLLGHAMGHSTWDKPEDPKMKDVVSVMSGYKGEFMGSTKSMADYFNGFSLMMFFVLGMSISVLWFVSVFAESQKSIARKILIPIGIMFVAFAVIEFLYFFPFAATISLGVAIFVLLAASKLKGD
jgi:hypothetical protein